jgi:hypothetical protein
MEAMDRLMNLYDDGGNKDPGADNILLKPLGPKALEELANLIEVENNIVPGKGSTAIISIKPKNKKKKKKVKQIPEKTKIITAKEINPNGFETQNIILD